VPEPTTEHPRSGAPGEPRRLASLPLLTVDGHPVRVATTLRSRLLGLAFTDRRRAGPGLLIPACRSIHTFGMRFALDVVFLDAEGAALCWVRAVPPRRFVAHRRAAAVLELPAAGVA
jgi:hypothetical protein